MALPSLGRAQALYNNGATLNIASGTTLYVVGNLTNDATATINNSGTLEVRGNIANNGVILAPNASTITFNGSAAQTVSGTSTVSVKSIIVNNAAGVTITTPLSVDGAMTFTSGILTATNSSAPVIFTANGTVSGTPTNASHINGYVRKLGTGAFVYPIGNTTNYQPVGINLSANSTGVTALYNPTDAGTAPYGTSGSSATPLLFFNKREYWELSPVGTATGTVTLYFDAYNNVGIGSIADLRVAHKSSGQWLNEGGTATGTVTSGSVTSNSISTFSPFTLGSVSTSSPLPIHLLNFTAKAVSTENLLEWQTASEEVGTSFEVERSDNGSTYSVIGTLNGQVDNSTYVFHDEAPYRPVAFYRLRIADGNGNRIYSSVAIVRNSFNSSSITITPIPADRTLRITNADVTLVGQEVAIYNMQGAVVYRATFSSDQSIDISNWATGVYSLRLPSGKVVQIMKN
jgi:hypothetical protein